MKMSNAGPANVKHHLSKCLKYRKKLEEMEKAEKSMKKGLQQELAKLIMHGKGNMPDDVCDCECGCLENQERNRRTAIAAMSNMERKCWDIYLDWEDRENEQLQVDEQILDRPSSNFGLNTWNRIKSAWSTRKVLYGQHKTRPKYDYSSLLPTYEVPILNVHKKLFVSLPQGYLQKQGDEREYLIKYLDKKTFLDSESFYLAYNGRIVQEGVLNLPDFAYLTMFIRLLGGSKAGDPRIIV
uniref:Uncharacterized protein n=1 Tax=Ditylenchus dipsaci TaxID=166011 RepID=A0A915ETF1_9BILA